MEVEEEEGRKKRWRNEEAGRFWGDGTVQEGGTFAEALEGRSGRGFARTFGIAEAREQLAGGAESLPHDAKAIHRTFDGESLLASFMDARARYIMLYFVGGRPPSEQELWRWRRTAQIAPLGIKKVWGLGKGFFAACLASVDAATQAVLKGALLFKGNVVQVMPYVASFDPEEALRTRCPVWISFPKLKGVFYSHAESFARLLGRVLHSPGEKFYETMAGPRFCILWDLCKEIPEVLVLDAPPLGEICITVKFAPFPHACYNCRSLDHFARSCPHRGGEASPVETAPVPVAKDKGLASDKVQGGEVVVFSGNGGDTGDGFQVQKRRARGPPRVRHEPPRGNTIPKFFSKESTQPLLTGGGAFQAYRKNIGEGPSGSQEGTDSARALQALQLRKEDVASVSQEGLEPPKSPGPPGFEGAVTQFNPFEVLDGIEEDVPCKP